MLDRNKVEPQNLKILVDTKFMKIITHMINQIDYTSYISINFNPLLIQITLEKQKGSND